MGKLIPILVILLLVWLIFFYRTVPRWMRRLGRQLGELKKAGKEIFEDSEVPGSPLARYEDLVGKSVAARILASHPLSPDLKLQERIARIGGRLAAHASRKEIRYRFAAIEKNDPNAFAVPGGAIFITRPLVALCGGDDNRLAGVLAHEVAHIDRRHVIKAYAARAATQTGLRALTLGRGAIIANAAGTVGEMISQGYSRERELEADRVGSQITANAGYDPLALARLFRELEQPGEDASPGPVQEVFAFFKSHPPLSMRIQALESYWSDSRTSRSIT